MNWFILLFAGIVAQVADFFTSIYCKVVGHKWLPFINGSMICGRCGKKKGK